MVSFQMFDLCLYATGRVRLRRLRRKSRSHAYLRPASPSIPCCIGQRALTFRRVTFPVRACAAATLTQVVQQVPRLPVPYDGLSNSPNHYLCKQSHGGFPSSMGLQKPSNLNSGSQAIRESSHTHLIIVQHRGDLRV